MNKSELLTIIKSNFYSILYYNAEIWLIPALKVQLKKQLLSASASPLKLCYYGYNQDVSYEKLHETVKYPTPKQNTMFNKMFNPGPCSFLDANMRHNTKKAKVGKTIIHLN